MKAKGGITSVPQRQLRLMLSAQIFWLAIVCLLGAWWCRLVLSQAARIAELESAAGMEPGMAQIAIRRTHRMLYWESGTYVLLLLASSALVFWLYWRDVKRVRGIQAFFASMTHELRTPLTSIRLQAESIAENLSGDATQVSLVGRLLEDTMRLEGQVERTLELARVEGGGQVFPQPLELKPWLERMISHWKEAYGERVHFEVSVQDITVTADPTALQIVMKNLLENSLRHAKRERLEVRIRTHREGQGMVIAFSDNGAIYKGDSRRLGQIFQKGAASQGAGVGLYLMRVLVEQMGGWVKFRAAEGFEVAVWLSEAPVHGG
jgi:signal transduction histidine kinase